MSITKEEITELIETNITTNGRREISALKLREVLDIINDAQDEKQEKLITNYNLKSINGETLLGSGNIIINDGKSAYDIAVDHGFKGTEEEWLDSLYILDSFKKLTEEEIINALG